MPLRHAGPSLVDDELRERFADLPVGVHLAVVSDSCHSGSVTCVLDDRRPRFLGPRALGRPAIAEFRKARCRTGLYSASGMHEVLLAGCKANQYSMDASFDDTPSGAFSYHALAAIREAEGSDANLARQIFT